MIEKAVESVSVTSPLASHVIYDTNAALAKH
jgi:hypothetical protein